MAVPHPGRMEEVMLGLSEDVMSEGEQSGILAQHNAQEGKVKPWISQLPIVI